MTGRTPSATDQVVHLSVTLFVCPGNAGHDYGTIEQQGFRRLVVERDGRAQVIGDPG